MIQLRNIVTRLCVALLACAIVVGCKRGREIPEEDLVNIFHDAFIANAYLAKQGTVSAEDSLLIYEPILAKYGYTVAEFRSTLEEISMRKSSRISKLLTQASERLEEEAAIERKRIIVLDTIDNVAKRTYTRTIYSDSLIHATRLKDTTKLRVTIDDIIPGTYTLTFDYYIDTLDENRNSRIETYLLQHDTLQVKRHTQMLSRYREGSFSRRYDVDTVMDALYVNFFYHPRNEESKTPDIKITNLKVVRVLPLTTSLDSLYSQHFDMRLFNIHSVMWHVADTLPALQLPALPVDTLHENRVLWHMNDPLEWYRVRHGLDTTWYKAPTIPTTTENEDKE